MLDIVLPLIYTLLFGYVILKSSFFKNSPIPTSVFLLVFVLKIGAGTFLYWIYTYYYSERDTADIFKYFDDSYYMTQALWDKPGDFFRMLFGYQNNSEYFSEQYYDKMNHWFRVYESSMYNDSHAIIRFNAVVRLFSFGNYHVHTVFMCFVSLMGLTALYKSICHKVRHPKLAFVAIFLLPSTLLWGSGVLKEGLMFFGLGFIIYSLVKLNTKGEKKLIYWFTFIFALMFLLFQVKFYVLAAFSTGILAYTLTEQTSYRLTSVKYLISATIIIALGLNFHYFAPEFNVLDLIVTKQKDFIGLVAHEQSGSRFELTPLTPDFWSLFKTIPEALTNSLFRPYPWDVSSFFMLIATLENILVVLFLLLSAFYLKPIPGNRTNLALLFFSSSIILLLIVGWTTPVAGALIRYKIPGTIALLISVCLVTDFNRLKFRFRLRKG